MENETKEHRALEHLYRTSRQSAAMALARLRRAEIDDEAGQVKGLAYGSYSANKYAAEHVKWIARFHDLPELRKDKPERGIFRA